jgi:hypothetical protein
MATMVILLVKTPLDITDAETSEKPEGLDETADPGPTFEKTKLELEVTGLRNPTMARNWLIGAVQTNAKLTMSEAPIHQPQLVRVKGLNLDRAAEIIMEAIRSGERYHVMKGQK